MPKIKLKRYQRVKTLNNVIDQCLQAPESKFPWEAPEYADMKKVLELGCGKGEHSLGFAAADPNLLCIGVDLKGHRLCVGAEKAIKQGIDNLFFLRTRVEEITSYFPDNSIHGIWLTFPDPHPKQRGIKHRLSSAHFLNQYARLLVPGGRVHLKTDSHLLFTYTRESVEYWGGEILAESNDLRGGNQAAGRKARQVVSTFESKALARDKTIKYLEFTLNV